MTRQDIENLVSAEVEKNCKNLECDGTTRVLDYILSINNIAHTVYVGYVYGTMFILPLHYWIELPDSTIIDYKLRMWAGSEAPEGFFTLYRNKEFTYVGEATELNTDKKVYEVLCKGNSEREAYHQAKVKERMKKFDKNVK
jgi:hypothetical protein